MSWPMAGRLFGRQIMSPRLTSSSSSRRMVTDIGGVASSTGPSAVSIDAMRRREARRQHDHLVAGLVGAARHEARVPAVVVEAVVAGRMTYCTGKRQSMRLRSEAMCTDFEVVQQRRALVPRHVVGTLDDVVTEQRRHRDEREVVHVELRRELPELVADALEDVLVVVDEVHLVDAQHEVGDTEQRREERVAPRLFDDAVARVDRVSSARSAVEAPVTMLRVYWMWPGVSAMMNLRVGVAK